MSRRRHLVLRVGVARVGLLLAVTLASCNGCEEEDVPETTTVTTPTGARHLVGGVPVGTIEGVVRLADGEDAPSYPESPFDVATAGELPSECSPPHGSDRSPLAMDDARGLANVAIAATGDPEHWIGPGDSVVHEVRIHDCRLTPVTITATRGDTLHVVNETSYPFMPDLGLGMLQSVLPSDPLDALLDRAGPRTIVCGFAAPCGRVEVVVMPQPVHTVSGAGGRFRIENAPADQDITVTAMHATILPATAATRVTEGGTAQVEIVVHRFTPPEPPPSIVVPPGQEIDPGSPHDTQMTPEELQRLREEARRLAAEGSAPTGSAPPPPTSSAPVSR